jgi:hypothetical protein
MPHLPISTDGGNAAIVWSKGGVRVSVDRARTAARPSQWLDSGVDRSLFPFAGNPG